MQIAQGQKMQAVGQLAGGIAHDFNNMLTAIIGFSDFLLMNHRPTDPAFQDIINIKQNANRAAGLVRQLLAFSRQQTLRPQVLQLGDVLSELSILLGRLLGENIELTLDQASDLWPVKADLHQFEQVIINLAVNARDAMPDGGKLIIRTANIGESEARALPPRQMPPGEYVLIQVIDTGTGMSEEVREKIFEPFFSTKEVGRGTGLGLSTVYGIVKQTGGYVFADSAWAEGTTMSVYLPRYIETAVRDRGREGRAPAGEAEGPHRARHRAPRRGRGCGQKLRRARARPARLSRARSHDRHRSARTLQEPSRRRRSRGQRRGDARDGRADALRASFAASAPTSRSSSSPAMPRTLSASTSPRTRTSCSCRSRST